MRRPPQAGNAGRNAGKGVGPGRAGKPHGRGRGILFVIGMQHHDPVHRGGQDRIDDIVFGRNREAHVHEVAGIAEAVLRIDEGLADRVFIGHCRNGRKLGDHADRRHFALPFVVDIQRVVVEGAHRAHDADHRGHRVAVAAEPAEEVVHLFMHHRVPRHALLEIRKLRGAWQVSVKQQEADFEVVRPFGQLLDRVAAIQQLSLVAVDIGDRAFAGGSRGEAGIIGEDVTLRIELADVDHIRTQGWRMHRQVDDLVPESERRSFGRFGHVPSPVSCPPRNGAGRTARFAFRCCGSGRGILQACDSLVPTDD